MRYLVLLWTLLSVAATADVDELKQRAAEAAQAGDIDRAIHFYEAAISEAPDDGGAHYRLGSLLMDNDGDLNSAIDHFEQAANAGFQIAGVHYRLSRIYSRRGEIDTALDQLESAAKTGFLQYTLLEKEPDFAIIEDLPRFAATFSNIRSARFPCENDARHRAFDFWIGDWTVTVGGQYAGTNNISSILGGCTIFEQWSGAAGGGGKSFNYYDPGHDHWRQIWIGDNGVFIEFTGTARDGGIFYTAETINPADKVRTYHKFEFTKNKDGSVRQFWQTSADRENWTTIWDGHYTRVM